MIAGRVGAGRPARVGAAILVAAAALLVRPDADGARAADDGLRLTAAATYELQIDEQRVRVTIDVTATNTVPDESSGIFTKQTYFESFRLAIQPEATRPRASSGDETLAVTTSDGRRFDVIEVRFGDRLYFEDTVRVRLRFDLPAGTPRSSSDVRVGVAFSTFVAWAFGDSGQVRIEIPASFAVESRGSPLQRERNAATTILTSGPIDGPEDWYAIVDARRDEALTTSRLDLPLGEEDVVVRGWPEDEEWVTRTTKVLSSGLPVLSDLVGLPWPVSGTLEVIEIHTPLLEGYGGFYDPDSHTITVSEDLDSQIILHEASHAFFNGRLFRDRWIGEGLADAYSAMVLQRTEGATLGPDPVDRGDRAAFALVTWREPQSIKTDATAAYEAYGYSASWLVMKEIIDRASVDDMRKVLGAADSRAIPYRGDGPAETMSTVPDWRRLLDLVEELADVGVADLFATWVADDAARPALDERAEAREAYRDLVAAGDGWLPPYAVRAPMSVWRFALASSQIESAMAVLELRDEIDARAADLGVHVPPGLEADYENQVADVGLAMVPARARLEALSELESMVAAVALPRDALAELGLLAEPAPEARLDDAKAAFENGEFALVAERSDALGASLAAAPEVGRGRAILGGASLLAVVGIGLVGVVGVRRARRQPASRSAAAHESTATISAATTAPLATLPPTLPGDVANGSAIDPAGEGGDEPSA
jgi:hypothetical protein